MKDFLREIPAMSFWWLWSSPSVVETAIADDFPALADLHERAFASGWSADDLGALARQAGVSVLLARRANVLGTRSPIGFVITRVAADEAEILTIAVDPAQQGRGIGAALMRAVMSHLYAERVRSLFLEVDAANASAVALYRKLGFKMVGERRGYYRDSAGDGAALVMRVDLA